MNSFIKYLLTVTLICISSIANSQEKPTISNQEADKIVNCAVYFLIYSTGLEKSGGNDSMEAAKVFNEASKTLTMLITKLKSDQYVVPRFQNAMTSLTREMNGNFKNFESINTKYHQSCLKQLEYTHPMKQ